MKICKSEIGSRTVNKMLESTRYLYIGFILSLTTVDLKVYNTLKKNLETLQLTGNGSPGVTGHNVPDLVEMVNNRGTVHVMALFTGVSNVWVLV